MRYIIIFILPLLIMADTIDVLYKRVISSNIYKSKKELINVNFERVKESVYKDGWNINIGTGYADVRDGSDSGNEFALSVGKKFNINGAQIDHLINNSKSYYNIQEKILENRFKTKLWKLYGNYCTTMQALQAKAELAYTYDDIKGYMKKGALYGEFDSSKVIMASLAFDNLKLQLSKLENIIQSYESQIKAIVEFDGQFECKKLGIEKYKLFKEESSLLWSILESDINNNNSKLEIANQVINKMSVNAAYTNEIDTDRYMLNLLIPLNISANSEAKRAIAMSKISASNYKLKALKNSYKHDSIALKNRLDIYTKYLKLTEKSMQDSADKLIQHSNMRFLAGEESLLSMLKAVETKIAMIESMLGLKIDRRNAVSKYMYDYAIDPNGVKK